MGSEWRRPPAPRSPGDFPTRPRADREVGCVGVSDRAQDKGSGLSSPLLHIASPDHRISDITLASIIIIIIITEIPEILVFDTKSNTILQSWWSVPGRDRRQEPGCQ